MRPERVLDARQGTQFLRNDGNPVPDSMLTTPDGRPGLKAEYSESTGGRPGAGTSSPVLASRTERNINLSDVKLPAEVAGKKTIGVHWTGFLTSSESGDYLIGIRGSGFGRLSIYGKQVATLGRTNGIEASVGRVHLEKGHN